MCYLVAKKFDSQGSVAWKTRHGKQLSGLIKTLNDSISPDKGVQLVVISDPNGYGEYAPYKIVSDESSFRQQVMSM